MSKAIGQHTSISNVSGAPLRSTGEAQVTDEREGTHRLLS